MKRVARRWLVAGAVGAIVVLLAACSSDDEGGASTTTTADGSSNDSSTTTTSAGSSTGGSDAGTTDGTGQPGATDSPSVDLNALPPVDVGEAADFGSGLFATVTDVESVDLEAQAPGETGGPGVLVTIELRNDTDASVDLGGVSVNATYDDGTPAVPHQTAPISPFSGTLKAGKKSTGVYAFRVPQDQQGSIVIDVHQSDEVNFVIVDVGGAVQ